MLLKPMVADANQIRKLGAGDVLALSESVSNLTTVGAGTLTGALLAAGLIKRSGSVAAFTDTTDTAANIIAALNTGTGTTGVDVGTSWRVKYLNTVAYPCTLAAGTGVTLSGNTAIPGLSHREFLVTVTNGTPTSTVIGNTTSSSKVVTGLTQAQTNALSVGQAVTGTNIAASSVIASIQSGTGFTMNNNATGTGTAIALTCAPTVTITSLNQGSELPDFQYVASTANGGTHAAGDITGYRENTFNTSGQATPTWTTRTAAQMVADIPNCQTGTTFKVKYLNRNSGTMTVAAGSGVTITGTATLATVTWKEFICTVTNATAGSEAITMQVGASALL